MPSPSFPQEWGDRKKPWRYRWPDEVREEVLARLLELNAQRAKEETRTGPVTKRVGKKGKVKREREPPTMEDLSHDLLLPG